MSAPNTGGTEADAAGEQHRASLRLAQYRFGHGPRGLEGQVGAVVVIRDLRPNRGGVKQFPVVGIGMDQVALNTAFQRSGEKQAEYNGHVAGNHVQPRQPENSKRAIDHCQYDGNEGQHGNLAAVGDPAFDQHRGKGG